MDINQKLAALLSETADIRTEVENQALEMVKVAVLKLVPTLMADEAAELVSKFISTILKMKQNCLSIFIRILYHMRSRRLPRWPTVMTLKEKLPCIKTRLWLKVIAGLSGKTAAWN